MKGLMLHVGDDQNPGKFNSAKSDYRVELLPGHADPDLTMFTYGDWKKKTGKFDELAPGDYLFFSFKLLEPEGRAAWYITSYFRLLETVNARELLKLQGSSPYKYNAHVQRGDQNLPEKVSGGLRVFVGEKAQSRGHLMLPIPVDKSLWKALNLCDELGVSFTRRLNQRKRKLGAFTEAQINGSYLRTPKLLSEAQTKSLIRLCRAASQ